jgi:hypothetical protein
LRRHQRTKEDFHLHLLYPEDEDFAQLQWQEDSLRINLAFDKVPFDYQLITPKTEDGKRDLSCLISGECEPAWALTQLGLYKQEQQNKRRFLAVKQKIDYQVDSLIAAHFPNDFFDRLFELECITAYYYGDSTYTALNCEVPIDTNLYRLTRHYRLKSPPAEVDLKLSIYGSVDQAPYFLDWQFGNKKFMPSELNFVSPAEIREFAAKEYPEVDFAEDAMGQPYLGLVYLSALPQNTFPKLDPKPTPPLSAEMRDTTYSFSTFAYLMQSALPEQGEWSGMANYYFYAQKARLIIKTDNYYDLTDE